MDAAELDYRTRTLSGCIPPSLVARLVELGHAGEVEFQARRGEWFCTLDLARRLAGQDRRAEALQVLDPYVATGWWGAARTAAELLEEWGRADEAIALVRPHADAGDRLALNHYARLLTRHGRGEEAFALLRPHVEDWFLAEALVEAAEGTGLDEEAADLLAARIGAAKPACDDPSCGHRTIEPFNAIGLLATIRERQGRVNEAIALLRTRETTSVNDRDQLADLLARHDRIAELRAYAAADPHGHGARRLAELLEERGDVEGAIAVYRRPEDGSPFQDRAPVHLAELLVRHGRGREAAEVMRSLADSPGGAEDWIVSMLCGLYADQGRAEDGLAYLDALRARRGREDWEFFRMRLPLLVACGRREEAIAQARAHPEGDTWYAASSIAELLADAGRAEDAVALLQRQGGGNTALAGHLIELGRVKDAIELLQRPVPRPTVQWQAEGPFDTPPF